MQTPATTTKAAPRDYKRPKSRERYTDDNRDCAKTITGAMTTMTAITTINVCVSMSGLLDSVLCPRESEAIFHNYKCVMGLCQDCGTGRFRWCLKEFSSEIRISIKLFESVGTNFQGKVCKRKDLVRKLLKPREFASLFVVSVGKFIKNNFIYSWQAHKFKTCIFDFPNDVVVLVVDLA